MAYTPAGKLEMPKKGGWLRNLYSRYWLWLHDYCKHGVCMPRGFIRIITCDQCRWEKGMKQSYRDAKADRLLGAL